jgi:hypothetical protein
VLLLVLLLLLLVVACGLRAGDSAQQRQASTRA